MENSVTPSPAPDTQPPASSVPPQTAKEGSSITSAAASQSSPPAPKRTGLIIGIVCLIVILVAATGTMAAHRLGVVTIPFLSGRLAPEEVLQRMFVAMSDIELAQYTFDLHIASEDRDADAEPIEFPDHQQALRRDQQRFDDAAEIAWALQGHRGENGSYPSSLLDAVEESDRERVAQALEREDYGYRQERGGEGFVFMVRLETDEAAEKYELSQYGFDTGDSHVIGINEDTYPYSLNVTSVSFNSDEFYEYIPANFQFSMSISGAQEANGSNRGEYNVQGRIRMDGTILEGDADFVVDGEEAAYVRVNEFPSLGFFNISTIKSQWIQIALNDLDEFMAEDLKEDPLLLDHYQLFFETVHSVELLEVAQEHPKVKEGDRGLYHYEITISREKLAELYQQFAQEAQSKFGEQALLEYRQERYDYLQSPEFASAFDSWQRQTTMELWIDDKTFYPAKASYSMRFVPSDEVGHLQGKQLSVVLSAALDNVNQPVAITIPDHYISFEEAMALLFGEPAETFSRSSREDAYMQSHMSQLRTLAEVYYDNNGSSYAGLSDCFTSPSASACKDAQSEFGLFAAVAQVWNDFTEEIGNEPDLSVHASDTGFCISQPLPSSGNHFCADSTGRMLEAVCDAATNECVE